MSKKATIKCFGTYDNIQKIELKIFKNDAVIYQRLFINDNQTTLDELTDKVINICTKHEVKNIEWIEGVFSLSENKDDFNFEILKECYLEDGMSKIDYQISTNVSTIKELKEHGDLLSKEREINHWLYFPTKSKRKECLCELESKGYDLVNTRFDSTTENGNPFILQISKASIIDSEILSKTVIELCNVAEKFNGEYDGWETEVITN